MFSQIDSLFPLLLWGSFIPINSAFGTTNLSNSPPKSDYRCGIDEYKARTNCGRVCIYESDCNSNEYCWGTFPNVCYLNEQSTTSTPVPTLGPLSAAPVTPPALVPLTPSIESPPRSDFRCGRDEEDSRTNCGKVCVFMSDCNIGEYCWSTFPNTCYIDELPVSVPTDNPTSSMPLTDLPVTLAPTNLTPTTFAPVKNTSAPINTSAPTISPTAPKPLTDSPVTTEPTTSGPMTSAPIRATFAPVTFAPVTLTPVTLAPVTLSPINIVNPTPTPDTEPISNPTPTSSEPTLDLVNALLTPVDQTSAPVNLISVPIDPTSVPTNPTSALVNPTQAPIDATPAPTVALVNPTLAPINTEPPTQASAPLPNVSESLPRSDFRCGIGEEDSRTNCGKVCVYNSDCESGEYCWSTFPNTCYASSLSPDAAQDNTLSTTESLEPISDFRCGNSEADARGNCKRVCTNQDDCEFSEYCWATLPNYCRANFEV